MGLIVAVVAIVLGGAGMVGAYEDYNNQLYPRYEVVNTSTKECPHKLEIPAECLARFQRYDEAFAEEEEDVCKP